VGGSQAYTWQLSCTWKRRSVVEARALRAVALPQVRLSRFAGSRAIGRVPPLWPLQGRKGCTGIRVESLDVMLGAWCLPWWLAPHRSRE